MKIFYFAIFLFLYQLGIAQEVNILNYSVNFKNQVQLEVSSSINNYYVVQVRHNNITTNYETSTSLTYGSPNITILTEALGAYPEDQYRVLEHQISSPDDTDGDGIDDITEWNEMPSRAPFNYARVLDFDDGTASVPTADVFEELSVSDMEIPWAPFLDGKQFAKFVILNLNTDEAELFFVNSKTHYIHQNFTDAIGLDFFEDDLTTGEIIYHPDIVAPSGTLGVYSFNYSFGNPKPFTEVQKTNEIIAANMPFLKNELTYYITGNNRPDYENNKEIYDASRISILDEEQVFEDINYLALNNAEGYGYFRLMSLDETPTTKDLVLYESLPNTLPRVAGIITSFIQTPLSHVNLRAIQDNVPNAFIRNPLALDSISNLLGKYIYFKVDFDGYEIREATLEEVNSWFENIRPKEDQIPILNLDHKEILPLDDISFEMSDGYGAKCTNVAVMRKFGFPEGTIPNGFGVPFYFYQEFMEYNDLFDDVTTMIEDENFKNSLEVREEMLKDFRKKIKDAPMPQWMLDQLENMHDQFPEGTSIRCRSSTNNEDLPGFSGAGLYTSKTQHPHEGHIQKSIKQVYASMWNFRAFEERDFYRINHYVASMGVLCHPNFSDEKANGVGVSTDPIYMTENTYYLNTQVGEDLVTNPEAMSIPEEILLGSTPDFWIDYDVIRYSSLLENSELILNDYYLFRMREYLTVIHEEFQELYNAQGSPDFAMDIEYKITSDDQLVIKQARPWVSFWADQSPTPTQDLKSQTSSTIYYPNPVDDWLNIDCKCDISNVKITNISGQKVLLEYILIDDSIIRVATNNLPDGMYVMNGIGKNGSLLFSEKFIKK